MLREFAIYPSCWSLSHHAAALLDKSAITQISKEEFPCFNDSFGENMFTLALKRGEPDVINEVLKTMSQYSQEDLSAVIEEIPLEDIMWYMNSQFISIVENAFVPAISDRGLSTPTFSWQAENEIKHAFSTQNKYNETVH